MDKELKLFKPENNKTDFETGKHIWDMSSKYPNKKIGYVIRKLGYENENLARRAYWYYLITEKCGLRSRLELENKSDLLNNYKAYMFVNYSTILKAKIEDVYYLTPSFNDYIYNLFLKTYELNEKELRKYFKEEIIRIKNVETKKDSEETEKLVSEIDDLKQRIGILINDNKELTLKANNNSLLKDKEINHYINSMIDNLKEDLKTTLLNNQRIFMLFITMIILILTFKK